MRKLFFIILLAGSCQQAMASQIVNPAASGGGSSGGGYALQPATVTIQAAQGVTLPDNTTVSTGAINLQQMANVGGINGAFNGNFDYWKDGPSFNSPPAGTITANQWQMDPAGSFSGIWFVARVSTVTVNARYALQWHTNGTPNPGIESIVQPVSNYYAYLGSSVTFTIWVNSTIGTTIGIRDSIGTSTSSAHAGDSAWHQLTVTRFIATSATSLSLVLANNTLNGTNNTVYYDGAMLVIGDTPINYTSIPAGTVGVTDGSNATAGNIGEYIFSTVSAINAPSSATYGDMTSISLTAGDWDVSLDCQVVANGATATEFIVGISNTSGSLFSDASAGDNSMRSDLTVSGSSQFPSSISSYRVSLSATTIYYAKMRATYTVATPQFYGRLSARRVR